MNDRRMPEGRRPVKRRGPSKTELKRRQLILEVAKETGRECALAIARAQKVMLVEEWAQVAMRGAHLMLERLLEANCLRIDVSEFLREHLEKAKRGEGGEVQVLEYGGYRLYPLDVDPETL